MEPADQCGTYLDKGLCGVSLLVRRGGFQRLLNDLSHVLDVFLLERGMDDEHQAAFAEVPGDETGGLRSQPQ